MRFRDTRGCGNLILDALPKSTLTRLRARSEIVDLVANTRLGDARRRYVHFPFDGLIAVLAEVDGHAPVEVALIGREAMDGAMGIFGPATSATRSLVLVDGRALRVDVRDVVALFDESATFRRLLGGSVGHLFSQIAQAVPCTRFHSLPSRLALWLLRAHDRLGASALPFTHQRLAELLGVQRSAVTLAAGQMNHAGVIRYARGHMTIVDRVQLTSLACSCYAIDESAVAQRRGVPDR